MSAWVLPDHIADVLPSEARHIEELRRGLLDTARSYGYELVMPPMLEYLESLLTGTGEALALQTSKLIDQLSGRTMGLRADMTQQVARIDAHLLNRKGVTRLCYCGPVVHARPDRPRATREPLQFGAEIYGHQGLEADLEALHLALDCLKGAGVKDVIVDLADVRIVRSLLAGVMVDEQVLRGVHAALASKDATELAQLTRDFPEASREGLMALLQLYGGMEVLDQAEKLLERTAGVRNVLSHLRWLVQHLDGVKVSFDLADLRGYSYYSGTRFAIYVPGGSDALVRGGRYDEVGAVFGRNRPAAGFSLDIKQLVAVVPERPLKAAIRAPWGVDAQVAAAIAALRQQGETVVCVLP
ncbi:MAG: ATP phosphoribosyltransferase regulatory subunit, partial [Comamonas sp.]|nr:ATP phosphoribosyltransferase regulatory subunit [Comamonas sp.]